MRLDFAGPNTGPHAHVERVWRKVRAARPANCARLGVNRDRREALGCQRALEYWPTHAIKHVDLACHAVGERQSQYAVPQEAYIGYVSCESDHRSGEPRPVSHLHVPCASSREARLPESPPRPGPQTKLAVREVAREHLQRIDANLGVVSCDSRVNVRWRVIIEIHRDREPEKRLTVGIPS